MRTPSSLLIAAALLASAAANAQVATETVQYYTEAVRCDAKLFKPANHRDSANAPGVVLAPGERATRASVEQAAQALARNGVVALAIDYRGWGDCGGFLYFAEPVRWDDRMRFTQLTSEMHIRRLRVDPKAQVIDVRNAITFLQGVPGVNRERIGVWGVGLSGGHAIVTAGSDARVRAIVARDPLLAGLGEERAAFTPTAQQQAAMIKLARTGAAPASERAARAMNAEEAALALAEYKPAWYLDLIPQTTAVMFVASEQTASAVERATKLLKGPHSVVKIDKAQEAQALEEAAQWLNSRL